MCDRSRAWVRSTSAWTATSSGAVLGGPRAYDGQPHCNPSLGVRVDFDDNGRVKGVSSTFRSTFVLNGLVLDGEFSHLRETLTAAGVRVEFSNPPYPPNDYTLHLPDYGVTIGREDEGGPWPVEWWEMRTPA